MMAHLFIVCFLVSGFWPQATSGEILGEVRDPDGAVIGAANVSVRNVETNLVRTVQSGEDGRFRISLLPAGSYEITVEKSGFSKYVRSPVTLMLNQRAELLDTRLDVQGISESLIVSADAPLINTTNAELGTNFDPKRISELPLAPDRNVMNLVLSAAGVSQLSSGNAALASGTNFSTSGSHLRSNNVLVDGQDANNANLTGASQEINNPDVVAEVRLITNQFAAEYGRAAGSVVNIVTKAGTNQFHGSSYWFYNGNKLNSRNNLDLALFEAAPWRAENQFAATLGGPVIKNKLFLFGSALRWTDRRITSGKIAGVPTSEGQSVLRSVFGNRPQVRGLLDHLDAAQVADTPVARLAVNGAPVDVQMGTLSGFAQEQLDVWQSAGRIDYNLAGSNVLGSRYLFDDRYDRGGQVVPADGLAAHPRQFEVCGDPEPVDFGPRS
jgi:carboxypeptidase family protein